MSVYIKYNQYKTPKSHKKPLTTNNPQQVVTTVLQEKNGTNINDPDIWGSTYWFTFHTGASNYPNNPSKIVQERMKGFIRGIPYIIPCEKCSNHALNFIEKSNLDIVCKTKDNLFKFFVDFHNEVNTQLGKQRMTLEQAKQKYMNGNFKYVKIQ